jgi:hypothetical protein
VRGPDTAVSGYDPAPRAALPPDRLFQEKKEIEPLLSNRCIMNKNNKRWFDEERRKGKSKGSP